MQRLVHTIMLAHGWRRVLLLLAAGAMSGLSVAPLFFVPGLFIGVPILVWSLDGAGRSGGRGGVFGAGFGIGFWFGLGYFTLALHWLGVAFFMEGNWIPFVAPFAVVALAALLALFWALAVGLAHVFWSESIFRIVVLAAALTLGEYSRGHLFSGFPFDLLGYALTANEQMMQAAALVGVYGLTFVAPLVAATPALIWPAARRSLPRRLGPFFVALGLLAGQLSYGAFRLEAIPTEMRDDMSIRLVQPNIDESAQWQAGDGEFVFNRLIDTTTRRPGIEAITHVIWPESAFPFYLSKRPEALARIARMLPPKTLLITGAPRLDPEDLTGGTAHNSILAINADGEIVASYAKTHLVPFGEYLPFKDFFAQFGITQFVPGNEGWTPGGPRRLMAPPGTPPFLPLVCYEAIFPGDLGPVADAQFLLNLTNDGWFDGSIGKAQHFHHARLRAVEEGKPMLRLGNTGMSAVIDPVGRLTASLEPDTTAALDISVPRPIAAPPYAQWRDLPLFVVIALVFAGAVLGLVRRRRGSRRGEVI